MLPWCFVIYLWVAGSCLYLHFLRHVENGPPDWKQQLEIALWPILLPLGGLIWLVSIPFRK